MRAFWIPSLAIQTNITGDNHNSKICNFPHNFAQCVLRTYFKMCHLNEGLKSHEQKCGGSLDHGHRLWSKRQAMEDWAESDHHRMVTTHCTFFRAV